MQPNVSFNRVRPSIFDETDQATHRLLSRLRFGRNGLFNHTEHTIEVGFIAGADLMIPRQVLDSVGPFDPGLFHVLRRNRALPTDSESHVPDR